jgi:hypothetical protein
MFCILKKGEARIGHLRLYLGTQARKVSLSPKALNNPSKYHEQLIKGDNIHHYEYHDCVNLIRIPIQGHPSLREVRHLNLITIGNRPSHREYDRLSSQKVTKI